MNILVTGAAGFIASHVVDLLIERGYTVIVYDCFDYCASKKNVNPKAHLVIGDILDADKVTKTLNEFNVTHVMHFAAQSHVDQSFGNSLKFTETNVLGTHTMLECCSKHTPRLELFMHVSTDEVYGENKSDAPFNEESLLNPTNPYASSKASAENYVIAYSNSYGMNTIITRGNNVYGPRQYPEKLIPKFILRAKMGMPLTLHGDGTHRRSFLYVTDVARAFICILEKGKTSNIYNIGTTNEIRNIDIATKISDMYPGTSIQHVRDRDFNDRRYYVEDEKLRSLGWSPTVSFEDGLRLTGEWYEENNFMEWWGDSAIHALDPHFVLVK